MRIEKFIDIQQEIEIDLSSEDIQLIFNNDTKHIPAILNQMNGIATFLNGISNEIIKEIPKATRQIITSFLRVQADRFDFDEGGDK